MLDLSTKTVALYWQKASPQLAQLFESIEQTEDWTVDRDPKIAARLVALARQLSERNAGSRLAAADRHDLLFFLVYISTSKCVRLIQWLDETEDGLGSRLLEALLNNDGEDAFARVADPVLVNTLFQRLRVIQNTPFFAQLLAPSMLGSIQRAIENYRRERDTH